MVGRQSARARSCRSLLVWVYGEGSANGKREDEDDVEKTRKIYYGLPHLGGEDAIGVRYSSGNLSLQIFIIATTVVLSRRLTLYPFYPVPFLFLFPIHSLFLSFCLSFSVLLLSCWCHVPALAYILIYIRIPSRRFLLVL